jgi:hypothetical protein
MVRDLSLISLNFRKEHTGSPMPAIKRDVAFADN